MNKKPINFNRKVDDFKKVFGVISHDVITRMNNSNDDIPNQIPVYQIKISKAGVIRDNVPVTTRNPFGGNDFVTLNSRLEIQTNISNKKRGLHMSRIGDLVANLSQGKYKNIEAFIKELALGVCVSQESDFAYIKLVSPFSFYEDVISLGKKNKKSLEHVTLYSSGVYDKGDISFESGIGFSNITACPCAQKTFKHTLLESGVNRDNLEKVFPLLTHSQRCKTKVLIRGYKDNIDFLDLLKICDLAIVRVQNTLPRGHELHMVYRSHAKPQFMEDVVRELAFFISSKFDKKYKEEMLVIETDSLESIHDFDIQAKIEEKFQNLKKILK